MADHIPYTTSTGVKIGLAYHRQLFAELDRDAQRIQRALLQQNQTPPRDFDGVAIAVAAIVTIAITLFAYWTR